MLKYVTVCEEFHFSIMLLPINPSGFWQYTKQIFKIVNANNCIINQSIIVKPSLLKGNFKQNTNRYWQTLKLPNFKSQAF